MKTLNSIKYSIFILILVAPVLSAENRANAKKIALSDNADTLTLVAKPRKTIPIEPITSKDRIITSIKPNVNPTANISLVENRTHVDPNRILKSPTDPSLAVNCMVDFSDYDALDWLPDFAEDTFAYTPWWFQACDPLNSAVVRPIGDDHFHLAYENPHIQPCNGNFTDWAIIHEDGSCEAIDPREEPRSLHPHLGSVTTHLYVYDGYEKQFFRLNTIRVENQHAIRLCYKPMQEDDGPWESNAPDGTTAPGIWFCWNELTTGNWDLSQWTDFITEVKITSSQGGIYQIDDIGIWIH
ncbi:MAG: hypothetical protein PVH37_08115 [Desulfobacterales bacterium]|jgi:hypothetical protein